MTPDKIRIFRIVHDTTVDGPGWRTTVYCAGCAHACLGCHNPETWDFNSGTEEDIDTIIESLREAEGNITFSGGDPLYQVEAFIELARRIRIELNKTIWCYTGFIYEEIIADPRMCKILPYLEVLVDGPFIESKKNLDMLFRGSSNQRLIDVQKSLIQGRAVEYDYNPFPVF